MQEEQINSYLGLNRPQKAKTFDWQAAFWSFFWFFYYGMYLYGAICIVIFYSTEYLIGLISSLLGLGWLIKNALHLVLMAGLTGYYAPILRKKHAAEQVAKISEKYSYLPPEKLNEILYQLGKPKIWPIAAFFGALILAAFAFFIYQWMMVPESTKNDLAQALTLLN